MNCGQYLHYWFILCTWFGCIHTASTFIEEKALEPVEQRRCLKPMPIRIPECQNTFYKFTGMPNLVGQETQFDARHQLQTFKPLITYKCSSKLNFFLCSVYTPMCDVNTRHLIGPCRPLCEHVKARCAPVLRVFDIAWPASLNCSRFPLKNVVGGTMCMEGPQDSEETPILSEIGESNLPDTLPNQGSPILKVDGAFKEQTQVDDPTVLHGKASIEDDEQLVSNWIQRFSEVQLTNANNEPNPSKLNMQTSAISVMAQALRHCAFLKKPTSYVYVNRTGRCAPLCEAHILFHPDAKTLSIIWTSVLTATCSLATSVTLVGYLIHSSLFRLPERPVLYIALCQLIYSLSFALGLGLGREAVTCGVDLDSGREVRLQEGLDNSVCALVFMVQYFFAIAGSMWWSLLTVHWALQYSQCWCSLCWEPMDSIDEYTSVGRSDAECWPRLAEFCPRLPGKVWDKESTGNVSGSHPDNDDLEPINPGTSVLIQPGGIRDEMRESNTPKTDSGVNPTAFECLNPSRIPGSEAVSYVTQNGKIIPSCRYIATNTTTTIMANPPRHQQFRPPRNYDQISVCLAREHVLVWLTAGLLTVGVIVSRQVDADELIPICSVGRQNTRAMGVFVIGPELIVSSAGLVALLAGLFFGLLRRRRRHPRNRLESFVSRTRSAAGEVTTGGGETVVGELQTSDNSRLIRNSPRTANGCVKVHKQTSSSLQRASSVQGLNKCNENATSAYTSRKSDQYYIFVDPLERRIGLFCFLYLIPVLSVTMCDLYEYLSRDAWLRDTQYNPSQSKSKLSFPPKLWKPEEVVGPNPDIFLLRIFMSLVPGFTCSLWMWSVKGCKPWTILFTRFRSALRKGLRFSKSKEELPSSMKFEFIPADQRHYHLISQSKFKHARGYSLSSHPYAVYQYQAPEKPSTIDGWPNAKHPIEPCRIETISPVNGVENQHSSATTPGYYSQAKVGSTIEPHMSDTLSEESPIPPPLPTTSRPHLPARRDPCIGASTPLMSGTAAPTNSLFQSGPNVG